MISFVIRCYNEEQHIGRLLTGIMKQDIKDDKEIILVDSGSTDATLSIASRYDVKVVHIPPEEFSFGRALNRGCEAATGELVVIVSSHCYPRYNDWLSKMIGSFKDKKVALVYGKQRGDENTKYTEHQIFAKWFPEESDPNQDHPFCNNANAVIRRAIWEKMPYDENLTGLEDLDWAKRAMKEGYKIAYSADAVIIHVHEESYWNIRMRYRREAVALKHIMHQQFSLLDAVRLFISNTLSDYYHAFRDGKILGNIISILGFRLMQFWGTYRGFSQHGRVEKKLKEQFYFPKGFKRKREETDKNGKIHEIDYSAGEKDE